MAMVEGHSIFRYLAVLWLGAGKNFDCALALLFSRVQLTNYPLFVGLRKTGHILL
jgi:hypothetical protein